MTNSKKIFSALVILIAATGIYFLFGTKQKSAPQVKETQESSVSTNNEWKKYKFADIGLSLSAPGEMQVNEEKLDDSTATIYIERGNYPDDNYYQLYGLFTATKEQPNIQGLKENLEDNSISETKVGNFPALKGQFKGERNRFVTYVFTDKGIFSFATSQPTKENAELTDSILATVKFE